MSLIDPNVEKVLLQKSEIPEHLQKYENVWKVTVTPRKVGVNRPVRAIILAAYNMRPSTLQMENLGRTPVNAPQGGDDLRPLTLLFFGKGTQIIRVMEAADMRTFKEVRVSFP